MTLRRDSSRFLPFASLLVVIAVLGVAFVISRQDEGFVVTTEATSGRTREDQLARPIREPTLGGSVARHAEPGQRAREADGEGRREVANQSAAPQAPPRQPDEPRHVERRPDTPRDQSTSKAPPASGGPAVHSGPPVDYSRTAMEGALADLGVDAAKMADLERRLGELQSEELELRQQAALEGWLDSPGFSEELEEIDASRRAIRDEIGDDAYDYFLFATGQQNRVLVRNVDQHSPADVAGLRSGDLILRYDGVRLFTPGDLLAEVDAATVGNTVRLDISRQGNLIQVEVPDGPLGIGFDQAQDGPMVMK